MTKVDKAYQQGGLDTQKAVITAFKTFSPIVSTFLRKKESERKILLVAKKDFV
jgi:hypothetical protein